MLDIVFRLRRVIGKKCCCVFQMLVISSVGPGDKFDPIQSSSSQVSITLYLFSLLIKLYFFSDESAGAIVADSYS